MTDNTKGATQTETGKTTKKKVTTKKKAASAPKAEVTEKTLPVGSIHIDQDIQARVELDMETVEAYADDETLKALPPIDVFETEGGTRYLADGFHRYEAHIRAGAQRIKCRVRKGEREDAIDYACGANAEHGLRRTIADKRRAAKLAIGAHPKWSDRKLAKLCKVSNHFIARVKAEKAGRVPAPGERAKKNAGASGSSVRDVTSALPTQADRDGNALPPDETKASGGGKRDETAELFMKTELAIGAAQRRVDELGEMLDKGDSYTFLNNQLRATLTGLKKWRDAEAKAKKGKKGGSK